MKLNQIKPTVIFLQNEILKLIANTNLLSDKERQMMYRNIENLISQFGTDVLEFVEPEIKKIYQDELKKADKQASDLDYPLSTQLNSQVHKDALANITSDTLLDLQAAIRMAISTSVKSIDNTLKEVQDDISRGLLYGHDRKKIIARVSNSFAEGGMKAFKTVDNKILPLDFYSETIVRTKISTARTHAHINRYLQSNNDLAYVTGDLDTCSECAKYQDRVFSITGEDDRFPELDLREIIPVHPNCKCSVRPFVIEHETDEEINKYIARGKDFHPDLDPRTKAQREAYRKDQAAKRKAREEYKQYERAKALLGDDAPKTLGAFRRMKRAKSKGYKEMLSKLRVVRRESRV